MYLLGIYCVCIMYRINKQWRVLPGLPIWILVPGTWGACFESKIIKLIIHNSSLSTRCENDLKLMPQILSNVKSTWVHVMAFSRQLTRQCWPRYVPRHGVLKPQGVNVDITALLTDVIFCRFLGARIPRQKWNSIISYWTVPNTCQTFHITV